jgi:hypothetical protein
MNKMSKGPSDKSDCANALSRSSISGGGQWPISSRALADLVDLGMSDDRIASYFGVEQTKVAALRAYFGLADHTGSTKNRKQEDKTEDLAMTSDQKSDPPSRLQSSRSAVDPKIDRDF